MNSRERGPGKIRKAKDRQEAFQIEEFGKRAERLLETYAWPVEERAFLRLVLERKFAFADIKLLTWDQFVPERNVLALNGREYYLTPETGTALAELLAAQAAEGGLPDTMKLVSDGAGMFSAATSRELRVALSRNE